VKTENGWIDNETDFHTGAGESIAWNNYKVTQFFTDRVLL
jgi:hypothetical protein